jgi:glycosyltransferase involved in cell wall biosynthesis
MPLSIVVPAFNEAENIGALIKEIRKSVPFNEIIVVDDGSTDGTAEAARIDHVKVISHPNNKGYGAAIKTGIEAAQGDWIVTIDADGQHNPQDINKLWRGCADLSVGSRQNSSGRVRGIGKWVLKKLAEYLSGKKIPDLNSGMKLARREDLKKYIRLCPDGMSFSDTLTLLYLQNGKKVNFVPIAVRERHSGKSTISLKTALETVMSVLNVVMFYNPLRIFLPLAVVCFTLGTAWAVWIFTIRPSLSTGALLLILTGLGFFFFGMLAEQIAQMRKQL